ncbi:protein NUCLEAR FUSION DEFECTIVE 4-like [Phalaenopsis equestris]|uniref:protein NUCLEAR FUSION DEFECTIVE 4-like n=1 Tax=Phalaenopsis equestris TaxID=78828 RepID=UPI0009E1CE2B|nr:protein NUCLEAR FUSION DEFECTIVE 4-like [Phalaenopsis equestris]
MSSLPWLTLSTIIWLQAIAGTNTDFPAYSSELKSRLHITQFKLNNLAVASDAGKLLGWCAGFAAIRLPPLSLLVPASHRLLACICWLNVTGYRSVMRQFLRTDQGAVIALTTSYMGLTANIYLALAQVIVGRRNATRDKSIYLMLNAVTPAVVGLLVMPVVAAMREKPRNVKAGLLIMFVIAGTTGAYAVIETMFPAFRNSSEIWPALILLVLLAVVIVVPVWKVGEGVMRVGREGERVGGDAEGGREEEVDRGKSENVNEVCELVKRMNFWIYFMVYMCGATLGLVYGNNLGQISESRGVSDSSLLSVYSSFGFFGRLATAPLSTFFRSKYKATNTGAIAVLMFFMSVSFFVLLSPSNAALFVSTAIIGLGSGAISSIAVSVSSELFGQENFSVNHNIVISNIPIGSFFFGSIAALIYDRVGVEGGRGESLCIAILSIVIYLRSSSSRPSFHEGDGDLPSEEDVMEMQPHGEEATLEA